MDPKEFPIKFLLNLNSSIVEKDEASLAKFLKIEIQPVLEEEAKKESSPFYDYCLYDTHQPYLLVVLYMVQPKTEKLKEAVEGCLLAMREKIKVEELSMSNLLDTREDVMDSYYGDLRAVAGIRTFETLKSVFTDTSDADGCKDFSCAKFYRTIHLFGDYLKNPQDNNCPLTPGLLSRFDKSNELKHEIFSRIKDGTYRKRFSHTPEQQKDMLHRGELLRDGFLLKFIGKDGGFEFNNEFEKHSPGLF
ncbi:MAG: hypothetical protein ABIH83_01960 [Candidatus Micrarchaeota archaeon]